MDRVHQPVGIRPGRVRTAEGPHDAAVLVHLEHLHLHDLSHLHGLARVRHPAVGQLRDVHQPVDAFVDALWLEEIYFERNRNQAADEIRERILKFQQASQKKKS